MIIAMITTKKYRFVSGKNDIEHITNEIVEFILITFDELKLNL